MGQFPGCHAYNHNPAINYDLIFARQWRNSAVSGSSIAEFLAKVSDRWWVLEEAKRRIGEELSAAPLLLHYALAITSTPLSDPLPRPAIVWAKVAARQRNSLTSSTSTSTTPAPTPLTSSNTETKRTGGNGEEKDVAIASATAPLRLGKSSVAGTGNTSGNSNGSSNPSTPMLTPLQQSMPSISFQLSLAGGTLMDSDHCPFGNPLTRLEAHMCLYRVIFLRIQARINTFIALLRSEASDNNTLSTNHNDASTNTSSGTATAASINPLWFTGSSPTIIGPGGELWSLSMFLQCDLLITACEFARDENFSAVECLLAGHSDELATERLRICSSIPETCSPLRYGHLLPRANAHPLQSQSPPLFADWVDTRDVIKRILAVHRHQPLKRGAAVSIGHIKRRQIQRRRYLATGASCFTDMALTRWYIDRMRMMDQSCGQLQSVSQLCDMALSYHINGLTEYRTIINDLLILVYQHDLDLNLIQYEALDDFGRLCLVLSSSRPDTIAHDIRVRASMFFDPSRALKLKDTGPPLLHRYILHCASIQRLDLVTAILEQCKSTLPIDEQLITDQEQLLTIAISAVYSSLSMDSKHWSLVSNIFECLPTRRANETNERLLSLQDRIDLFELHLGAAEILTRHGLSRPLSFFIPLPPPSSFPTTSGAPFISSSIGVTLPRLGPSDSDDTDEVKVELIGANKRSNGNNGTSVNDECRELLKSISRKALRNRTSMSESDWELLLTDVLDLHTKIFWFVSQEDVLLTFCESVLAAAQFSFARRLFALLTGVGGAAAAAAPITPSASLPMAAPVSSTGGEKEKKSRTGLFLTSRLKALTNTLGVSKKLFGKSNRNKATTVTTAATPPNASIVPSPSSSSSAPFSPSLGPQVSPQPPSSSTSLAAGGNWVTGAGTAPLPISKCELVVLRAAREFFNSAPSADHHDLQLAEDCLALLPLPSPFNLSSPTSGSNNGNDDISVLSSHARTLEWQRELEFIEGIRRLVAMGVKHVVPLQVRLSTSRLDFIKKILELNPLAYQNDDGILGIARCFGLASVELQCEVRVLLIKAAIARHDAKTAVAGVRSLMEVHRYRAGWRTCQEVSNAIEAIKTKHVLLSHALWSCHINDLDALLLRWKILAIEREQKEVRASMPTPTPPLVITDDDTNQPLSDTELLIIQTLDYNGSSDSLSTNIIAADQSCKRRRFAALGLSAAIDASITKRAESGAGAAATTAVTTGTGATGVTIPSSSSHSIDVSLLRLAEESCLTDPLSCFAYLCSLSQSSLAHDMLQRLLADTTRRYIDRQQLVQTGLRYFAARSMALYGNALLPTATTTAPTTATSSDGKRSSADGNVGIRADTRILSTPMNELEEYVYQLTRRKRAQGPLPKDLEYAQVYVTAAMHLRRSELAAKRNPAAAAAEKKAAKAANATTATGRPSLVVREFVSQAHDSPPLSPLGGADKEHKGEKLASPDPSASRIDGNSPAVPTQSSSVESAPAPSAVTDTPVASTTFAAVTESSSAIVEPTAAAVVAITTPVAAKPVVTPRAPPSPPLELMIASYVTQRQYTKAIQHIFKVAGVHPRMQAMDYGMAMVKKLLATTATSLVPLDVCVFISSGASRLQRASTLLRLPLSYTLHDAKIALHIASSDMPTPARQQWTLIRSDGAGAGPSSVTLDNDHATLASYGIALTGAAIEVDTNNDHHDTPFVLATTPIVDYTKSLKDLLDAAQATVRVDGL